MNKETPSGRRKSLVKQRVADDIAWGKFDHLGY
jgi:hypothetical protein